MRPKVPILNTSQKVMRGNSLNYPSLDYNATPLVVISISRFSKSEIEPK